MILDNNNNKMSAYKKAKYLVADALQSAFYGLEVDPENTKKMTEKEQEEIMKYTEKIVVRIETNIFKKDAKQ